MLVRASKASSASFQGISSIDRSSSSEAKDSHISPCLPEALIAEVSEQGASLFPASEQRRTPTGLDAPVTRKISQEPGPSSLAPSVEELTAAEVLHARLQAVLLEVETESAALTEHAWYELPSGAMVKESTAHGEYSCLLLEIKFPDSEDEWVIKTLIEQHAHDQDFLKNKRKHREMWQKVLSLPEAVHLRPYFAVTKSLDSHELLSYLHYFRCFAELKLLPLKLDSLDENYLGVENCRLFLKRFNLQAYAGVGPILRQECRRQIEELVRFLFACIEKGIVGPLVLPDIQYHNWGLTRDGKLALLDFHERDDLFVISDLFLKGCKDWHRPEPGQEEDSNFVEKMDALCAKFLNPSSDSEE